MNWLRTLRKQLLVSAEPALGPLPAYTTEFPDRLELAGPGFGGQAGSVAELTDLPSVMEPQTEPAHVWVVDDDEAVLALLKSLFAREGYTVKTSSTLIEALEDMPDIACSALIVLDFNIPGGNGLDVLRELRTRSGAPVVMVSNIRRPELVAQAFELGADDFIEKPFDPRSLVVRARRLIE